MITFMTKPQQINRDLDVLIQRVKDMHTIQPCICRHLLNPDGDGLVKEVWFPNRLLPMKADIFSRVPGNSYRSGVNIYTWMHKLGFKSHD
ncbi:poly-beta-1,6-N-acetyl-D-glucosamine N-deacetylase PgaB [Shigella sonnei]